MKRLHITLEAILQEIRPKSVPPAQKEALNSFKQEVRESLQKLFPLHVSTVANPFEMGSTKKGTDIALKYDLDLFLPFRFGFGKDTRSVRTSLLHALQAHYKGKNTIVRDQRVSVGLIRMHGSHILHIDVVPGVEKSAGAYKDQAPGDEKQQEDSKYLELYDRVANKTLTTNVHRQVRLIKQEAQHYRDTVRLLKAWRFQQPTEYPLGSYAIELMVYEALRADSAPKTGSHDKLLLHVLQYCCERLPTDWELRDIGANNRWKDYLKPGAKQQLAGLWRKLITTLQSSDEAAIRRAFLG